MTFSYDSDADTLYVTFESASTPVTYLENGNGDVITIERESGKIVGCTILFFMRRAEKGAISIPEIGVVPFNAIMDSLISERTRDAKGKHKH